MGDIVKHIFKTQKTKKMKYNKVVIKQIPNSNATAINLEKYNRSRFPNCFDVFEPYQFPDGRYLTGLDPDGLDLLLIKDEDERAVVSKEREVLTAALTKAMGKMDLSPSSEFWASDRIRVKIDTNQEFVLNKANPLDIVKYHYLIANGYVAPSKEESSNPRYLQSNYYCHVDEVEATKNVSTKKLIDKAKSKLSELGDNKDYLYLIGAYLQGTRYKRTMSANTLYLLLSDFIEDSKNPENVSTFLKAANLSVEDLQYKVTVETAIRKRIIKFKEGQYYRGGVNLGRNIVEVLATLSQPDFANEFLQIHEEVNTRF